MAQQSANGNRPKNCVRRDFLTPDNWLSCADRPSGPKLVGTSSISTARESSTPPWPLERLNGVRCAGVVLTTVETKSFSGDKWPHLLAVFPGGNPSERSSHELVGRQKLCRPAIEKADARRSHCRPLDGNLCFRFRQCRRCITLRKAIRR